ncbi:carbonic anhydrase [Nitritalea halalkaliphila]|nr:hypothetical protein [Nitritalea halalkaliphila]
MVANVMHGVQAIHDALPEVEEKIKSGKLRIIGAIYDMETGKVRTLEKKL